MKVAVLTNMIPFVRGGAEELADHLVANIRAAGAEAELIRIPFSWQPAERLLEEMLLCQNMRLFEVDRVVALKFPAYLIPYPEKVLWLLHQFRQAYDLWDNGQSNIPQTMRGQQIRSAIKAADEACFAGCRAIYTNHATTAERLRRYNGVASEVLMPPLNDPELFEGGRAERYVLASGRVNSAKRQHLAVEAMRHVRSDVRLVVAGPPDGPEDAARLQQIVERHDLGDRVRLDLRFLSRGDLAELVNHSLGVVYLPFDEDSVGYVSMEAANAAKPVVTSNDSGGVLDLVHDGQTGLVVTPEPEAIAEAIETLAADGTRAAALGQAGRDAWLARDVTWPATVRRLLA